MTTDLDRLIEAVKAGNVADTHLSRIALAWRGDIASWRRTVQDAYNGSLDSAMWLLEALLPGWLVELRVWPGDLCVVTLRPPYAPAHQAQGPTLARALLLATLRAYRSTREDG